MPILSAIGRRHWRTRALIGIIYATLLAGAITMVYPFLLLLSGSAKSAVDAPYNHLIPRFLYDETALYQKMIEMVFNENLALLYSTYSDAPASFGQALHPASGQNGLISEWTDFLEKEAPGPFTYTLASARAPASRGAQPIMLRAWKRHLAEKFTNDLAAVNRELETTDTSWYSIALPPEDYLVRRSSLTETPFLREWNAFKAKQPLDQRIYFSVEGFYRNVFLKGRYTRDIATYNKSHHTDYASWDDVRFSPTYPSEAHWTDAEREDWESFARVILNHQWLRATGDALSDYINYLEAKYSLLGTLNRVYKTNYTWWSEIELPRPGLTEGLIFSDWDAFVQGWRDPATGTLHQAPPEGLYIVSLEQQFRDFLTARFDSLAKLNQRYGTSFARWSDVTLPQQEIHYQRFLAQQSALRKEFITRNFVAVWDYLGRHGRGLLNTAIYCFLAVLAALIVNPLAAYALSRYRPPFSYKVLLFLMLTMAFPPMVTQIPIFLLLRKLEILNTFWALVLPGLASGYAIFLLKGFFDSLPRELYESAEMDGAGEFRIFWTITMSLSQPILAVIALNAFTLAYGNFMFALLICQDSRMWTLMPWLYQLQQYSGPGIMYASILIAAVPTLVIFAFCQNIIIRGIVVPVEK